MLRKNPLLFPLVLFLGILFFLFFDLFSWQRQSQPQHETSSLIHTCHFYTKKPYEEVFSQSEPYLKNSDVQVDGGILPHHLLAARLIASFFQGLERQDIDTIVLLGPNHENLGDYNVTLSKAYWETPYGVLKPNMRIINSLLESTNVGVDEKIFETEHSIYNIMPFIKRTFSNATIVPIVLRSVTTPKEAEDLGIKIAEVLDEKGLVIASVDFSHNVSQQQAQANDKKSLEAIKNFSFDEIYQLQTDSNPSVYALLSFLNKQGAKEALVLENTNSAEAASDSMQRLVTSYATMYFLRSGLITLLMTGDVSLGRSVNYQISQTKNPGFPFERIAEIFKEGDITIINLESPLIKECPLTNEGMKLCGSYKNIAGLIYAGVDIVSIANNHIEDYGKKGAKETEELLLTNGIKPVKNGQMIIKNVKGIKLAILAYDFVKHSLDKSKLQEEIKTAQGKADVVLVVFHWGVEYTPDPTSRQREIAYLAIDSGADLVLGNHPHWVQATEVYKEKFIVYSHGNLIFDQLWSEETKEGVIGKYTFYQDQLVAVEFLPIVINNVFQASLAEEAKAREILGRMEEATKKLK